MGPPPEIERFFGGISGAEPEPTPGLADCPSALPKLQEGMGYIWRVRIIELGDASKAKRERPLDQETRLNDSIANGPTDYLGIKRFLADFYRSSFSSCGLSAQQLSYPDRLFDVRPARLSARGNYGYVTVPLGACFSGAANADFMVLMPIKRGYKILANRIAQSVNVLGSATNSFYDIEFVTHGSAFEAEHFQYKFNGSRYLKSGCTDWNYPESELDAAAGNSQKPVVTRCK
jgi:hypothetical protein